MLHGEAALTVPRGGCDRTEGINPSARQAVNRTLLRPHVEAGGVEETVEGDPQGPRLTEEERGEDDAEADERGGQLAVGEAQRGVQKQVADRHGDGREAVVDIDRA